MSLSPDSPSSTTPSIALSSTSLSHPLNHESTSITGTPTRDSNEEDGEASAAQQSSLPPQLNLSSSPHENTEANNNNTSSSGLFDEKTPLGLGPFSFPLGAEEASKGAAAQPADDQDPASIKQQLSARDNEDSSKQGNEALSSGDSTQQQGDDSSALDQSASSAGAQQKTPEKGPFSSSGFTIPKTSFAKITSSHGASADSSSKGPTPMPEPSPFKFAFKENESSESLGEFQFGVPSAKSDSAPKSPQSPQADAANLQHMHEPPHHSHETTTTTATDTTALPSSTQNNDGTSQHDTSQPFVFGGDTSTTEDAASTQFTFAAPEDSATAQNNTSTFSFGADSLANKSATSFSFAQDSSFASGFGASDTASHRDTMDTATEHTSPEKSEAKQDTTTTEAPKDDSKNSTPGFAFSSFGGATPASASNTDSAATTQGFTFAPASQGDTSNKASSPSAKDQEQSASTTGGGGQSFAFGFSTGATESNNNTTGFTFGKQSSDTDQPASSFSNGFSFNQPASTKTADSNEGEEQEESASKKAATTEESQSFATSSGFAFGGDSSGASAGFSFGQQPSVTTSESADKRSSGGGFTFGTASSTTPTFGDSAAKDKAPQSSFSFGDSATTQNAQQNHGFNFSSFGNEENAASKSDIGFSFSASEKTTEKSSSMEEKSNTKQQEGAFSFGGSSNQNVGFTAPATDEQSDETPQASFTGFSFSTSRPASDQEPPSSTSDRTVSFGFSAPSKTPATSEANIEQMEDDEAAAPNFAFLPPTDSFSEQEADSPSIEQANIFSEHTTRNQQQEDAALKETTAASEAAAAESQRSFLNAGHDLVRDFHDTYMILHYALNSLEHQDEEDFPVSRDEFYSITDKRQQLLSVAATEYARHFDMRANLVDSDEESKLFNDLKCMMLLVQAVHLTHRLSVVALLCNWARCYNPPKLYDEASMDETDFDWNIIYECALQDDIPALLSMLSSYIKAKKDEDEDIWTEVEQLIARKPRIEPRSSFSDYDTQFRAWKSQCKKLLPSLNGEICTLFSIFIGDQPTISTHARNWFDEIVGTLLYNNPTASRSELISLLIALYHHRFICKDHGTDFILYNLIDTENIAGAIKNIITAYGHFFAFHLVDMLWNAGVLDENIIFGTQQESDPRFKNLNVRERMLVEYLDMLMRDDNAKNGVADYNWKMALDYASTSERTKEAEMTRILSSIAPSTEKQLLQITAFCEEYPFLEQSVREARINVAKQYEKSQQYASCINHLLQARDEKGCIRVIDGLLTALLCGESNNKRKNATKAMQDDELIMTPPESLNAEALHQSLKEIAEVVQSYYAFDGSIHSERLVFVSQYFRMLELLESGNLNQAAQLITRLMSNDNRTGVAPAPRKFWIILFSHALPLLENDAYIVFNSKQTDILMECLEELCSSHRRETYLGKIPEEDINVIRLALTRNLSRAILEE